MTLREYVRKRRFNETPEPDAGEARRRGKAPLFVVQLHHARRRHYDFRLEIDGALKSWAVPKGPSLRPGDKRLAVEVEDHPLAYASFSGDIPAGQYGAGHVDIFDAGTWQPETEPLPALAKGHLDFELFGDKLRGRWTLVRTHLEGDKPQWLLLKRSDAEARDAEADDLVGSTPRPPASAPNAPRARATPSAAAASKGAKRRAASARRPRKADATWRRRALALAGARQGDFPGNFLPQLCQSREAPPAGEGWLHESKWDGYRLLASLDQGTATLRSRNDLDWTARVPEIIAALEALPVASARLDGELIAVDAAGRSDFGGLQAALKAGRTGTLRYALFDLPGLAGVNLADVPLHQRKDLLEGLLAAAGDPHLVYSSHVIGHGAEVFEAARRQHLEGIVSKAVESGYRAGERAATWYKVKNAHTDEFIVVGWTPPGGSRHGFGALVVADVEDGALRYAGRVGSGFDDAQLRGLTGKLQRLATDEPIVALPTDARVRAADVHWVRPELVIEIAFRGWTRERLLRQPSFQRIREDKNPEDLGMRHPSTTRRRADAAREHGKKSGRVAVAISHPERVVFPGTGITKQDVADYYRAIADWLVPEIARRPLSLIRCPGGAGGQCFFQKHHADALGPTVGSVPLKETGGASAHYVFIEDAQGLLELVQMNTLEFHPWGAHIDAPDRPDLLVFDLDPAPGIDWKTMIAAAREVRDRLAQAGLESFVRLTGGKGLHVVAPIRPGPDWDEAKAFCAAFAEAMALEQPLRYLATASKARREGRIFIDWLRNARGATSVASWSLRARAGAPVAVPLRWEELGRTRASTDYDLARTLRRARSLKTHPWGDFAALEQHLPGFEPGPGRRGP